MKLLAPFAFVIAMLVTVIWLDETPEEADLVFVNQNEVFTLDPQRMSYIQDLRLALVLYEGLLRWDNLQDFVTVPAAASQPEISDDGREYRFRIRPDARWSNDARVTAHDFIYAWSRAILPDTAADYSGLFFSIEGAEAFFTWRSEQTAAFLADPWATESDEGRRRATIRMVARLDALIAADDLPAGIAIPTVAARPDVKDELDVLRDPGSTAGLVDSALAAAVNTRTWLAALRDPDSRAAEVRWMWSRTEQRFAETVGLQAPDPLTLVVRLERPVAYFLDLVCFGPFAPVYRPNVEGWPDADPALDWFDTDPPPMSERRWVRLNADTGKFEQKHGWAKAGRLIGNGTHVITQWRYKRDLRLEQNPRFHTPEQIVSGSILALTIEDTNTAVLAFESGQVDWLIDVSTEYQADMLEEARLGERKNIHVFPTFGTEFYSFNCRPTAAGRENPFRDARVRRAFTMAINKEEIVKRVTRLDEPVLTSLIPPGTITGYTPPEGLPFDIDEARELLRKVGWWDRDEDGFIEDDAGRRFPVVDVLYTTNLPRYKWISLNLKSQWEQALGVQIELRGVETKFYKEDLKTGNFMIARGRWYGDYGDPTTFLDLNRRGNGNNDRGFYDERVEALLDEAETETDPVRRMKLLQDCERIIVQEEVPMLVLCQLQQVYMYEPDRMHGLSSHPRLTQLLWQMRVDRP